MGRPIIYLFKIYVIESVLQYHATYPVCLLGIINNCEYTGKCSNEGVNIGVRVVGIWTEFCVFPTVLDEYRLKLEGFYHLIVSHSTLHFSIFFFSPADEINLEATNEMLTEGAVSKNL